MASEVERLQRRVQALQDEITMSHERLAPMVQEHERLVADYAAAMYENARLHEQNAAMREIVHDVAGGKTIYYASYEGTFCVLCNGYIPGNVCVPEYDLSQFPHTSTCPVTKARTLLAQQAE